MLFLVLSVRALLNHIHFNFFQETDDKKRQFHHWPWRPWPMAQEISLFFPLAHARLSRKEMPLNEWPIWTVWEICIVLWAVTEMSVPRSDLDLKGVTTGGRVGVGTFKPP